MHQQLLLLNNKPNKDTVYSRLSLQLFYVDLRLLLFQGLTGFDSIVLCKYKHVARCVISALI